MNHDAERSSNVLIHNASSAGIPRLRTSDPRRVHRSDSLRKRLLSGLLSVTHSLIERGTSIVEGLRPRPIQPTRLEHAFFEILEEIARDARPTLRIVVTGQPMTLGSAIEEQVYRIQREALVNAIRHADATNIEAEVGYLSRRLRVVIRDNGCGFEPKVLMSGRRSHCGIRTMLEQAKAMGAKLEIWSKPRCGTEVELLLPFDRRSMLVPSP